MFVPHLQYTYMHTDYSNQSQAGTSSTRLLVSHCAKKYKNNIRCLEGFQTLTLSRDRVSFAGGQFKYCLKFGHKKIPINKQ